MSTPSKTLSELIPSEIILQELAAGVKALPTVAQCPVDPGHKITLHPDEDTVWGACEQCDFKGDSIDILKAKYGIASTESVLTKLEQAGKIKFIPKNVVVDYQIDKAKRENFNSFIKDAKDSLIKNICDMKILQEFGAKPPYRKEWVDGFGRFVGTTTRERMDTVFGLHSCRTSSPPLVLPYYDMPGRLANLRVVSYNSKGMHFTDRATNRSGGLFMLESVAKNAEYVIAVDDPVMACKVQLKQLKNETTLLPVVAWHPDTRYWPILGKRVVFWAAELTVDVFRQTKLIPGAHVCNPNMTTINFAEVLESYEAKNWAHYVIANAKPWVTALKDHLLHLSEYDAAQFARALEISPLETGELLFECTTDEKQVLSSILDLRTSIKSTTLEDKKIIERDGCWWTYSKKGMPVRISNASFIIEKAANYTDKGSYFIGTVTMDNRTERFLAPAELFMNNPTKWLRQFTMSHSMGVMRTLPGWDHRLVDVSFSFNSDKFPTISRNAVVGWSDDLLRFAFPNVTLTNGRVDESDVGLPKEDMPCCQVTGHPSQKPLWRSIMVDEPSNRVFWALMGCISLNVGARLLGQECRRIGVIGPQRNLSLLTTLLGLCTVQVKSPSQLAGALAKRSMHDIPVVVIPPAGKFKWFIDCLETSGAKNVIVSLHQDQAAVIGGKGWVFIDASDMSGPITQFNGIPAILADMVRILQLHRTEVDQTTPLCSILGLAGKWCLENKAPDSEVKVLAGAEALVTCESVYGRLSAAEAFLFSLFNMLLTDSVSVSRSGFSKKTGEVDISDKAVKISKVVMQKMMLPYSCHALTVELTAAGLVDRSTATDWYVGRPAWDATYSKWSELRESTP